jgi:hypothetical protein
MLLPPRRYYRTVDLGEMFVGFDGVVFAGHRASRGIVLVAKSNADMTPFGALPAGSAFGSFQAHSARTESNSGTRTSGRSYAFTGRFRNDRSLCKLVLTVATIDGCFPPISSHLRPTPSRPNVRLLPSV